MGSVAFRTRVSIHAAPGRTPMPSTARRADLPPCSPTTSPRTSRTRSRRMSPRPARTLRAESPGEQWGRIMHLKPLYRVRFTYLYKASVTLPGPDGTEGQYFFLAEGRSEGRITGRFRGANHPRRRTDRPFVPDFQGVIDTDGGAL